MSNPLSGNAAIAAGIAAGNININDAKKEYMDFSESTIIEQEKQAVLLLRVEKERRARKIIVTTADGDVKVQLRALGEPACYFAEGPGDRRQRLQQILAKMQIEGEDIDAIQKLVGTDTTGEAAGMEVEESHFDDSLEEEFYTKSSVSLLNARKNIAMFSFKKASERLSKNENNDTTTDIETLKQTYDGLLKMGPSVSQLGSRRPMSCIRFRPGGGKLLSGDWTGLVQVWNAATYNIERSLIGHTERVVSCAWHPQAGVGNIANNGAEFVTAGADSVAHMWSETSDKPIHTLKGHAARLSTVAWHPQGQYIGTTSYDTTWRLWDAETARELLLQEGHAYETYGFDFHKDGSLAASGDLGGIGKVWDLRNGRNIMSLRGHSKGILSMSFSPNGYHLATAGLDNTIKIWDLRKRNGKCFYTIPAHHHAIADIKYSNNSGDFLVSASYDQKIKIWSGKNFMLIKSLESHEKLVMSVDISSDNNNLVSSGSDLSWKLYSKDDEW